MKRVQAAGISHFYITPYFLSWSVSESSLYKRKSHGLAGGNMYCALSPGKEYIAQPQPLATGKK